MFKNLKDKTVVNKIAGNIGMVEAAQFVKFINDTHLSVTADDFLEGRAVAPQDPAEVSILKNALIERVGFLREITSTSQMSGEMLHTCRKVIGSMFRLGTAEYTIVGLRDLLELNRVVVKEIFLESNDPRAEEFLRQNAYMLGMNDYV